MNENIDDIVKSKLFEEEKQLFILLTSSPFLLEKEIYKFAITKEVTEEGISFQQDLIFVEKNYIPEGNFEEESKKFPSASLKTLIRK